ncbi:ABC transporter substrate binding protein [Arcobacter sp. LA11]|uniref:sensor histidine kinase n=1 Tax=Arcobacter sp. LA11 TaxID=1898176 RepID=UPI00093394DE|nr:ABC transporter substrate binding protein [Arcobacter sp. LA11]
MNFKVFLFLISLIFLSNTNLYANNQKNVLIINSYHRGFQWSDDVLNGIESVLYNTKITSTVWYMDSKRIASPTYYKELKDLYKLQLSKSKYDLVVAIDKFAYEFTLQNYTELFTNEPIYFVGIEQFSQDEVKKYNLQNKVSGLLEKRAISDIIKMIPKLIPNLKRLYIINDKSENGDDTDPFIRSAINELKHKFEIEYIRSSTLDELKKKFSAYIPNEAVFFIRFYNDKNGHLYKNSEIAEMIELSEIPVFTTDTLFIEKGSTGGKLVPIKNLGIKSGENILGILYKTLSTPFIKIEETFQYKFDFEKIKKFKLQPDILKVDYTYVNQPMGFLDKHRQFVDFVFLMSPFLLFLIVGLIYNLYLRIRNTKLLKQRMQFDKVLLDSIKAPIVWQDEKGKVVDSNAKFCDFMDLPCPQVKGKTLKDYIKRNKSTTISKSLEPFINNAIDENQIVVKSIDEKEHTYLINQTNYTENIFKTKGTVTVFTDITKEKQAIKEKRKHQEFVIQQSKLAEIGEVFSSIAHQWKSPLVEIATIAQEKLYNEESEVKEEDDKFVNDIMFQVRYMTETINSFQKFIMPSTQKIVFDINESVEEMLEIIRHNMKYNYINVNVNVEPDTNLMILGYKNELMQTLLNIVNNAKESIIKEKSQDKITQGNININIKNINNKVQIDISDNGGGIPSKYINQIFEPYFTTKKDGHGIGLYMAKLIIEDKIGGTIDVSNTKDGAMFTIQLELTK